MADRVPTSGPWQTDPVLQQLARAAVEEDRQLTHDGWNQRAAGTGPIRAQYRRYVKENRRRLGIPDNYVPDPRTGYQTLYDPNQNQIRDAVITGATLLGGGFGASALAGAAAASGGGAAPAATGASSVIAGTGIPTVAGTGVGVAAPAAAAAADGATWLPLLSAASAAAKADADRRNRNSQTNQSNLDRDLAQERLDFEESTANPFRHQLNQARSINVLEGMGNSSYRQPTVTLHGAYGSSMPQFDGGFSFESGPDGPAAARALEGTVMRGMTRPDDRTGGIDVLSLLAGNGGDLWAADAPEAPGAAVPRPRNPRGYTPEQAAAARGYRG